MKIDPISVDFVKILVIDVDMFCDSSLLMDFNCRLNEAEEKISEVLDKYEYDPNLLIIQKPMNIML